MKKIILAALICLLGLSLWWLIQDSGSADYGKGMFFEGKYDGSQAEAEADSSTKPQRKGATQEAEKNSTGRSEAEDVGDGRVIWFRVVSGEDEVPVADAEVVFMQTGDVVQEEIEQMGVDRFDPHFLFRRFGRTAITDSDGLAQLSWNGMAAAAFAELDGLLSDTEMIEGEVDIITLKVTEARGVTVQVVDSAGGPMIGVPVGLRALTEYENSGDKMEMTFVYRNTEAPDGKVVFRDLSTIQSFPHDPDPEYAVRIEVAGMRLVQQLVTMDDMREIVVLVMPATGAVEVEVVDESGTRLLADGEIDLVSSGYGDQDNRGKFRPDAAIRTTSKIEQGLAKFPWVGIDRKLRADLRIPSRGVNWFENVSGPTSPGQTARVVVTAPSSAVVRGRLLLDDGAPAVRRRGRLTARIAGDQHWNNWGFRTDNDGFFLYQLPEFYLNRELEFSLTCFAGLSRTYFKSVDGVYVLSEEDIDLGEVQLEPAHREIRGRCVDPDGNGVGGFLIFARRADGADIGANVQADGSFHFQGTFKKNTLLTLNDFRQNDWVLPKPVAAEVDGAEEVIIHLFPAGSISGQVALDPDQEKLVLEIEATRSDWQAPFDDGSWRAPTYPSVQVAAVTGNFTLTGLDRGTYNLLLRDRHWNELAQIDGIQVEHGQTASDPRLNPWRYLDQLRQIDLMLLNADGKKVLNSSATIFRGEKRVGSVHDGYGRLHLEYSDPNEVSILLHADGYRPQWLDGTTDSKDVIMQRGIEVTIHCESIPPLEKGEKSVELFLLWQHEDARVEKASRIPIPREFANSGSCKLTLPGPGRFDAQYQVLVDEGGAISMTELQSIPDCPPLSVTDQDQGKTYHLFLPSSLLSN